MASPRKIAHGHIPKLLWLTLAVALGAISLFAPKVFADPPPAAGSARPARLPPNVAAALLPPGAELPRPAPPAPPLANPAGSAAPSVEEEDPVGYAKPIDGKGVPIHEGPYQSPFAHPHLGSPILVRVGLLLANVRNYDIQRGSFEADFYLTYTSDRPMPTMDPTFTNGKMDAKEVMADTPTFKMYRFLGTFTAPPDVRNYPFDEQQLVIEVEDDDNGTDQVQLVADKKHTNLDLGFEVPGWETRSIAGRVVVHNFPDRFDHDDLYYSRYEFTLGLQRYGTSAVFTVFVPAIVIVLISLTGLWFPREELEVRSNATTPMLAAAVLFHFSLTQALPATAYLTRADKLMMSVYAVLGFHMLISLMWFVFDEAHTLRITRAGKWLGVPVTLLILALGVLA
jgi:hypothetical protein